MDEYSIESRQDKIYHKKTKEYFSEVLKSYRDGSYRSAVVMLWSVMVCDLLFKIKHMVDMYSDSIAELILQEIDTLKSKNEKSSEWEIELVRLIKERTEIIDGVDYENLLYLQKQRHLSAHPVLTEGYELHRPNRETVRALIRNTLDGVLIKPPIYTRKISDEFMRDLSDSSGILLTKDKLKIYIENKYLSKVGNNVKVALFKMLWKFVFSLINVDCERNRTINLWALEIIYESSSSRMLNDIQSDKDYYANIAKSGNPAIYLIIFLSHHEGVYQALNDAAKLFVDHICENDITAKCLCWFKKDSLEKHYEDLLELVCGMCWTSLNDAIIPMIINLSDSPEWDLMSKKILNSYYADSDSYDTADLRFNHAIKNYIKNYGREALIDFITKVQGNSQACDRSRAKVEHTLVQDKCLEVLGDDYRSSEYEKFRKSL